ncbi:MAG: response regulator transcription factor [Elusimicrobia bacterium]|nr:response regulator transcription factor [Elusimicrobiota bacterium]
MQPYLLLIGGRQKPRKAAAQALADRHARIVGVPRPDAAWTKLARLPLPNLIVFDVPAFGEREAAALQRLRGDGRLADTSILVLASKADDASTVAALARGADEFLAEPIEPGELSARIRAMLRRLLAPPAPEKLIFHDIGLVAATREVRVGDDPVPLTETQFKVLQLLVQKAGRILERDSIIRHLWHTPEHVATRSADMHISLLRRKLKRSSCRIETVRPAGYRLVGP